MNVLPSDKRPRFTIHDLKETLFVLTIAPFSWCIPSKLSGMIRVPFAVFYSFRASWGRVIKKSIRKIEKTFYGYSLEVEPRLIQINRMTNLVEKKIQYIREFRPGGWKPKLRVQGRENLDKALEGGHGVILWIAPFYFNNLLVKKSLFEAGYSISHLSVYSHGVSQSVYGIRFLNPIWIKAEEKYLQERIVIQPVRSIAQQNSGGSLDFIRKIELRLSQNGIVSIACEPYPVLKHKSVEKNILNGSFKLATGPPNLAVMTGCALIPVFVVRNGPDDYEIVLEQPITILENKKRKEKIDLYLKRFAQLIETYLLKYPDMFSSWHNLTIE